MRIRGLWAAVRNRLRREEIYSRAEYWDSKAEQFEGSAVSMWPNDHLNELYDREQKAVLGGLLGELRGIRLLDVGCGYGRMSRFFASRGAEVVGVDFSPATIELARRHTDGENPGFRVQSVFDLDDEHAYDLVALIGTVSVACRNRAQLGDVLTRLHRALRPGGRLVILEPIHRGFLHRVLDLSLPEFLAVTRESGFEVASVTHVHYWPVRLLLAYVRWPRSITRVFYGLGELVLGGLLRRRRGGDYQAILALPSRAEG